MRPLDLIATAQELVAANKGKPRQSNLHRATSTAYYALFHTLARACADMLVGTVSSKRSEPAWQQVYRAVDHRDARKQCGNPQIMPKFPQEVQDFADRFVSMQLKRHNADYDPATRALKSEVVADIEAARIVIDGFANVDAKDRRAFAVWVLIKNRQS